MSQQLDEEAIFGTARRISDERARDEYLTQICAGDAPLRERVEDLLRAHVQDVSLLKSSPGVEATTDVEPIAEQVGQQIGRYKLLQKIGEGGFGVVHMAEQLRPLRRKVALKIIKPGMDTGAVVARFEAERQALALMDHPHIARVLDGGATDSGRPYFVMELVRGVPITEFCDKNQLSTAVRLGLFVAVCQAVQHAHQKGIIHRDIKPSNVLVTLHDGVPVVKVIDFGVAKAINQQLTEKTLFTAFGQMVGTPQYMSPEQAEMSGLDVDTRSDIYSLGVLLYELLTGSTPIESQRLRDAGFVEMQRLIQEDDPPKPSTRLSTIGEQLPVVAKHRSLTPDQLQREVRGDLDWIVMKALEKDRSRRYETPSSFAEDVTRYLEDAPVDARPPSASYRFRKFLRRNRGLVTTMGLVTAVLLVTTGGSSWLAWDNLQQRMKLEEAVSKNQALLDDYRNDLVEKAMFQALGGDAGGARGIGEKLADMECAPSQTNTILGIAAFYSGDMNRAEQLLRDAYAADSANVQAASTLFVLQAYHNQRAESDLLLAEVLQMNPRPEYFVLDQVLQGFALMWHSPEKSEEHFRKLLTQHRSPLVLSYHAAAIAEIGSYLRNHSITSDHLALMDEGLKDIQYVRSVSPPNYWTDLVDLFVRMVVHDVYEKAGEVSPIDLEEATKLAHHVATNESSPVGSGVAAAYFSSIGRQDLLAGVLGVPDQRGRRDLLACVLIQSGKTKEAQRLLSVEPTSTEELLSQRILNTVVFETETTEDAIRELFEENKANRYAVEVLQYCLAAKKPKLCRELAAKLLNLGIPPEFGTGVETRFIERRVQHLAEQQTADWLLEVVDSNREAADAYFQLAMLSFAAGDTESARASLQQAVDERCYWGQKFYWASALKDRIK